MATYLGKNALVKIGNNTIAEMAEWTLNITSDPITQPVFGSTWDKVHGLSITSWDGSVSGLLDMSDTNGQVALNNATISGTKIDDLKLYIDGTKYWAPDTTSDTSAGCYITSMSPTATQGDVLRVSFSFKGTGPIKFN